MTRRVMPSLYAFCMLGRARRMSRVDLYGSFAYILSFMRCTSAVLWYRKLLKASAISFTRALRRLMVLTFGYLCLSLVKAAASAS